jgi:hypothetical protein
MLMNRRTEDTLKPAEQAVPRIGGHVTSDAKAAYFRALARGRRRISCSRDANSIIRSHCKGNCTLKRNADAGSIRAVQA